MLDQRLLDKVATKKGKSLKYIRQQVSKRANRMSVTSQVALVIWAKELGISITSALQKLDPNAQQQVWAASDRIQQKRSDNQSIARAKISRIPDPISAAFDLLTDPELRSRCSDIMRRKKHLDRVIREATVVLEDRIKQLSGIKGRINPVQLVNTALNPNPSNAILVFGTDPAEQEGFYSLCKGIMLTFRNSAHHELHDDLTQAEALKFCAFIDYVLQLLTTTRKVH